MSLAVSASINGVSSTAHTSATVTELDENEDRLWRAPAQVLTTDGIIKECIRQGLYRNPICNSKLYLHGKGYTAIAPSAFKPYTDVAVLWLEGNALSSLPCGTAAAATREGDGFVSLYPTVRQLYLHNNAFCVMPDLRGFARLDAVNLANNFISKVEPHCAQWDATLSESAITVGDARSVAEIVDAHVGLCPHRAIPDTPMVPVVRVERSSDADSGTDEAGKESTAEEGRASSSSSSNAEVAAAASQPDKEYLCPCSSLHSLNLAGNRLATLDDIIGLLCYKAVRTLDLSNNSLADGEAVLAVVSQLTGLRSLRLTGNPCVRSLPRYRRTVLARCPGLMHLDDRPVFDEERRLVTAWAAGGDAAEVAERAVIKAEAEAAVRRRISEFRELLRERATETTSPAPAVARHRDPCADPDNSSTTSEETEEEEEAAVESASAPQCETGSAHPRSEQAPRGRDPQRVLSVNGNRPSRPVESMDDLKDEDDMGDVYVGQETL